MPVKEFVKHDINGLWLTEGVTVSPSSTLTSLMVFTLSVCLSVCVMLCCIVVCVCVWPAGWLYCRQTITLDVSSPVTVSGTANTKTATAILFQRKHGRNFLGSGWGGIKLSRALRITLNWTESNVQLDVTSIPTISEWSGIIFWIQSRPAVQHCKVLNEKWLDRTISSYFTICREW